MCLLIIDVIILFYCMRKRNRHWNLAMKIKQVHIAHF